MADLDLPALNERRKITASFLNNLATVFVATGVVTPAVTFTAQLSTPTSGFWNGFLILWLVLGAAFHLAARSVLAGVK